MTFTEYVGFYGLARSEGLVLRYLADAYKALRQTVPEDAKTEELNDLIEWLGELVRQVDSSLLDEWERAAQPRRRDDDVTRRTTGRRRSPRNTPGVPGAGAQRAVPPGRAGRAAPLRRARRARRGGRLGRRRAGPRRWSRYFEEHDEIGTGPDARGPALLIIDERPGRWAVRQIFDDPAGDHDWGISAEVDLAASDEAGTAVVTVTGVDQL